MKPPILINDLGMSFPTETSKQKRRYGLYICPYCGSEFRAATRHVKSGNTQSCGCYNKQVITTHGLRGHPLYEVWHGMIQRTTNPKNKRYKDYGGRGIKVSDDWRNDFKTFYDDMIAGYKEGLTIDRRDNDKGYSKKNCRWTTSSIQAQNTRRIKSNNTSDYRGVSYFKPVRKWIAYISINKKRIHLGYHAKKKYAARAYDTYVVAHNLDHTINGVLKCRLK